MEILRENKLYALILLVLIAHMFWLKFQFQEIIYIIDYFGRILLIGIACYVFQFKIDQFIGKTKLITISNFWLVLLSAGLILIFASFNELFLEVLTQQRFSNISIYLISSSVFALLHLFQSVQLTIGAFIAGLVLMYVYKKSGTLWVPIVSHYLVNLYFFGFGIPFVTSVILPK